MLFLTLFGPTVGPEPRAANKMSSCSSAHLVAMFPWAEAPVPAHNMRTTTAGVSNRNSLLAIMFWFVYAQLMVSQCALGVQAIDVSSSGHMLTLN